jgi:hypothetical protein
MTPQTAAALRAQSDVFDHPEHPFTQWMREFGTDTYGIMTTLGHQTAALNAWNAALAAVLTQEGAGIPVPYELLHDLWAHCDLTLESGVTAHREAGELLRPFHEARGAEPRAAEGAGTDEDTPPRGMEGRNWYAEYRVAQEHAEQIDDLCVANARALFRALHPGEPYDQIEREQSHDITCEAVNRILQPTAAAAVPAGGDAAVMAVLKQGPLAVFVGNANGRGLIRIETDASAPIAGVQVCSLTRDKEAWATALVDGFNALAAPAPRGGVTEDVIRELAQWMAERDGCDDIHQLIWEGQPPEPWGEVWNKYEDDAKDVLEKVLAICTPPAAQAQDAGLMARHWRKAFEIWAGNATANGEFDRIEQRARALAAKEAK